MRPLLPLLLLVSLLLAMVLLPQRVTGDIATLERVTLLARNGARGLSSLADGKVSCDACDLSPAGKATTFELGAFLMDRYDKQLDLGTRFDPTRIMFRAAGTTRTIVTAQGAVKGMYPNSLPLVKYDPEESDEALSVTKSWPSWIMRDAWRNELHVDDVWAVKQLGESNIATLARFLPPNNEDLCMDAPSLCAFYVYDSFCANATTGQEDPALQPLLGALEIVSKRFAWRLYGRDATQEVDGGIGSLAATFLRRMLSDFGSSKTKIRLSVNVGPMPVVFAALSDLGGLNAENTLTKSYPRMPQFGDAIAFEQRATATQKYVQAYLFASPSSPAAETGSYTAKLFPVRCVSADGTVYFSNTTDHGCPVEDLLRHLDSLGDPDGQCYATSTALAAADCTGDVAPPTNSVCHFYRSKCPGAQCGLIHGAIADPSRDFACQDAHLKKNTPYLAATLVAIGAPCVLAGAIAGFYLSDRIRRLFGLGRK